MFETTQFNMSMLPKCPNRQGSNSEIYLGISYNLS